MCQKITRSRWWLVCRKWRRLRQRWQQYFGPRRHKQWYHWGCRDQDLRRKEKSNHWFICAWGLEMEVISRELEIRAWSLVGGRLRPQVCTRKSSAWSSLGAGWFGPGDRRKITSSPRKLGEVVMTGWTFPGVLRIQKLVVSHKGPGDEWKSTFILVCH